MNNKLAHLASTILNQPLFLEPAYAQIFFSAIANRLNIKELSTAQGEILTPEAMQEEAAGFQNNRTKNRPYQVVDGVAVLPVEGTLVHKYGYVRPASGMTGYDGILARAMEAAKDPDVKGILLDQDSPGGSVAGCFDTVRTLRQIEAQSGKPIWSLCFDMTCSASMAIATGASRRLITSNGQAGSVGVIMAHASYEKYLEEEGVKVTLIHSGAHKADGNPYQNLPDQVLKNFTAETDKLRNEFSDLVARSIGVDAAHVLNTEAKIYRGQEAIDIGFANELINGNEAVAYFSDYLKTHNTTSIGVSAMSEETKEQATVEKKPTESAGSEQSQPKPAATDARAEERARVKGITTCAEAKGREELAEHFAYNTDMSVEQAQKALAAAPQEQKATINRLDEAMGSEEQPEVGADSKGHSADNGEDDFADRAIAAYNQATGANL